MILDSIAKKLEGAPKGFKLYCPIFGDVFLEDITDTNIKVRVIANNSAYTFVFAEFNRYGQYRGNIYNGECLLFPSKDERDWDNFSIKSYDFKPFDKVIVRQDNSSIWTANIYSHGKMGIHYCVNGTWNQCLPYNADTAKLIGTTNNWEPKPRFAPRF